MPRSSIATNAIPAMPTMTWVSRSSCFCSGVLSASVWFSSVAMLPISVFIPVPVTIISPRPAGDRRVHEREADPVAEPDVVARDRRDVLEHRGALPGERRLLDLQGGRHEQPAVGRHAVAGLEEHDVARHQLGGVDLDRHAVAPHPGDVLQHLLEGRQARLRLRLLAQAEHRVEDRQADQHDRGARLAGDHLVHDRGADQDDLHQVLVLAQEGLQARLRLLGGEHVRAVLLPPPVHLRRRTAPGPGRPRGGWPPPPATSWYQRVRSTLAGGCGGHGGHDGSVPEMGQARVAPTASTTIVRAPSPASSGHTHRR